MNNQKQSETRFAAKDIEAAINSAKALRGQMAFLTALTPKERASLPRVTPARLTLMESALQGARENQSLIPPSIELAKFENDVQSARGLCTLLGCMKELCSDVQDTLSAVGKQANNATQQVRVIVATVAKTTPTPGLKLLSQRLNPRSSRPAGREEPESPKPQVPAPVSGSTPSAETKAA